MEKNCFFCNELQNCDRFQNGNWFFNCPQCGRYEINDYYVSKFEKHKTAIFLFYNNLLNKTKRDERFFYYLSCSINAKEEAQKLIEEDGYILEVIDFDKINNWYPKNFAEKVDKILLTCAQLSKYEGFHIKLKNDYFLKLLFIDLNNEDDISVQRGFYINYFTNKNYLHFFSSDTINKNIEILPEGYEKIYELEKTNETSNQGFIAMSFDNDINYIHEAFTQAIKNFGYLPQSMKIKPTNDFIMPEIFYEIKKSKFIVVDMTKQNYGAYFEAGYAQALGKEVIICRKKDSEKPHFDIAQKSMIIWTDTDDLIKQLSYRIEATIGKNIIG